MIDNKVSQFRGDNIQTTLFDGVIATETEYNYSFIDWHYHQHSYFSMVISGDCREINRRGTIDYSTDSLLFHNYQDSHCSVKSGGISHHFQLELTDEWCQKFQLDPDRMPISAKILNPKIKLLFYNIYQESKQCDESSPLTIDALLLQALQTIQGIENRPTSTRPRWVKLIDEILHDNFDQPLSLNDLSDQLEIHAAHLSRDFPRYFNCNFSEYLRMIKVEKALALIRNKKFSLTDIALNCGFADQSHFIRCFKSFVGITPKAYRKIVTS